jgi:hypothetical protein
VGNLKYYVPLISIYFVYLTQLRYTYYRRVLISFVHSMIVTYWVAGWVSGYDSERASGRNGE